MLPRTQPAAVFEALSSPGRGYAQPRPARSPMIQAMTEILRQLGRGPDSQLAHVTPAEISLLRNLGGSGSRNPRTGLHEFFPDGPNPGDAGGPVGAAHGGAPGGGGGNPYGSAGGGPGQPSIGGTTDPSQFGDGGKSLLDTLVGALKPKVPKTQGEVIGTGLGIAGLAAPPLGIIGGVMKAMEALSEEYGGTAPTEADTRGPGLGTKGGDPRMAIGAPGGMAGISALMDMPSSLMDLLSADQSAIQQRSQITTLGLQGESIYNSPESQQYWINLLAQGGDPLPIEVQYASQVMGIPGFEGGDVETDAFLEALLGFEF